MSILKIKKVYSDARLPSYAKENDAGMDVYAYFGGEMEMYTLCSGDRALIDTGLRFEIEPGYEIQVRPKSGLALKKGITVLNSPGTVDAGYRNKVGVVLINHGSENYVIKHGDKIAQVVLAKVERAEVVEVEELSDSERGEGGFGSTGK